MLDSGANCCTPGGNAVEGHGYDNVDVWIHQVGGVCQPVGVSHGLRQDAGWDGRCFGGTGYLLECELQKYLGWKLITLRRFWRRRRERSRRWTLTRALVR